LQNNGLVLVHRGRGAGGVTWVGRKRSVGSRRWTSRSSDQTQADALIFATVFGKLLFRDLSEHRKATESFLARLDAENTVFIGDAYIYTSANTSVVETLQQDEKHLRPDLGRMEQ
jgi:hypothetical protein